MQHRANTLHAAPGVIAGVIKTFRGGDDSEQVSESVVNELHQNMHQLAHTVRALFAHCSIKMKPLAKESSIEDFCAMTESARPI